MPYIYSFHEGNKDMRDLLGGKGANLAEMTNLGLPVPHGFTITTETCNFYLENHSYPDRFELELKNKLTELEKSLDKKFGDNENPLLVSVRSGSKFSMPGMMDTILNLGLNDETVQGLIAQTQNERFCYDAYRRFVNMFGDVVLGVPHELFEEAMQIKKDKKGVSLDTELEAQDLKELTREYMQIVKNHTGKEFPVQPQEQLRCAIEAVFSSWNNERANCYRKLKGIPHNIGTAVNVQAMVFGNMGDDCGTGVAFTRDPSTGEKIFYGEYLMNAQGEDVVAGIRTPQKLETLEKNSPEIYKQLVEFKDKLEDHYKDMQDIEFTIEKGRLFILQTRAGKRTAAAAIKIAVDMVKEGFIDKKTAVLRVDPDQLVQLLHPHIDPKVKREILSWGLPASPGAACGQVVFSADDAYEWAERGEKVILVRKETTPEDIHGMHAAQGILTSTGGMTSHAAVVARDMGKCCVVGAGEIIVNKKDKKFIVNGKEIKEGDVITLNGTLGEVIDGKVPMKEPELSGDFGTLMDWTDEFKRLTVRTNTDTPKNAIVARKFGAEGIGLCRTEHMFFDEDRIDKVREMILAKDTEGRKKSLLKLLPLQIEDFKGILNAMNGFPVTIRLLDPPLHEFMPDNDKKIESIAEEMGVTFTELKDKTVALHEVNPMLGHRGCRLGITYPEIYEMQIEAIFTAAYESTLEGIIAIPEVEVPLISTVDELKSVRALVEKVKERFKDKINFEYKVGTMIELPRACLIADQIAEYADFFSFGTNDLTQMTYGISRDDVAKFLPFYLENKIFAFDPGTTIDREGVGALMKLCVKLGRGAKQDLPVGICGEHGGEPKSIEFCHEIDLDFVSCSPYRVPVARLAAAHAAIKDEQKKNEQAGQYKTEKSGTGLKPASRLRKIVK